MVDDGVRPELAAVGFWSTPSKCYLYPRYTPSVVLPASSSCTRKSDDRSSDNLSPPPSRGSQADYMGRPHSGHAYSPYGRSALKPESLIKQTYSTTMTHPVTGKAKKFHVVAYSSKVSNRQTVKRYTDSELILA